MTILNSIWRELQNEPQLDYAMAMNSSRIHHFFITETRNRKPNNRGIHNRNRNFKNRARILISVFILFQIIPCAIMLVALSWYYTFLCSMSVSQSKFFLKICFLYFQIVFAEIIVHIILLHVYTYINHILQLLLIRKPRILIK